MKIFNLKKSSLNDVKRALQTPALLSILRETLAEVEKSLINRQPSEYDLYEIGKLQGKHKVIKDLLDLPNLVDEQIKHLDNPHKVLDTLVS